MAKRVLRRHILEPEIIVHKDATRYHLGLVGGEEATGAGLVAVAVDQVVGGRLHGLVHVLFAWSGAQAVEAEAVEFIRVLERAIVEDGVLHIGAHVGAGGKVGAVGEGQVVEDFAERAHCDAFYNSALREHSQAKKEAGADVGKWFCFLPSMNLLHLCDSRMKESSFESLFTLARVNGTLPRSKNSCRKGSMYSGWTAKS